MNYPDFATPEFEIFLGNKLREATDEEVRALIEKVIKIEGERDIREVDSFLRASRDADFGLSRGIASTIIYNKTGGIHFVQEGEYGGLGLSLNSSREGLTFDRNQLWFARIGGRALPRAKLQGNALWYSQTTNYALEKAKLDENAGWFSINQGYSLTESVNLGLALHNSINSEFALRGSINSDRALSESINSGRSLEKSRNGGNSLQCSDNTGSSLNYARCRGNSLSFSLNDDFSLKGSRIFDNALSGAEIKGNALMDSNRTQTNKPIPKRKESVYNLTLEQIAILFGCNRERIRQLEQEAFRKIRKKLERREIKLDKNGSPLIFQDDDLFIKQVFEHFANSGNEEPFYRGDVRPEELQYQTAYPHYSSHLRDSDSVGYSAQFGNLVSFLGSGPITRMIWAQREGLFPDE